MTKKRTYAVTVTETTEVMYYLVRLACVVTARSESEARDRTEALIKRGDSFACGVQINIMDIHKVFTRST